MKCWYTPTRPHGVTIQKTATDIFIIIRSSDVTVFTAAVDKDTGPDNLTFNVSNPKKGHVALMSSPSTPMRHFKQAQINNRQVLFIHTGTEPPYRKHRWLLQILKIMNYCI
jgi:hypothetical protein